MTEITEFELHHLKDTLDRITDEMEYAQDACDIVFNSGAVEGIEESLVIVNALLDKIFRDKLEQLEG